MSFDVDLCLTRGGRQIAVRFRSDAPVTALFGPSGAGKTSVLEAVSGLLRPDRGCIAVAGEALFDSTARINLPPERRGCGFVFQDLRLFPHRTVRQNLLYGHRADPGPGLRMALDEACAFLGIEHLLARMPRTLSGGEAQRVAIGRALLSGPGVLLLDEPLAALDAPRREEVMAVIERIRDELRLPMLLVSHQRAEVERLAGHVVEMPLSMT